MGAPALRIVKRNGETVPFDAEKITNAIYKAAAAVGGHDRALSERLTAEVVGIVGDRFSAEHPPTVEDVQDIVERILIKHGFANTAKAYIVYRHERSKMRRLRDRSRVEFIPYKTMWQMLDWCLEHECETVAKLNGIVRDGRLPKLVQAAEQRYEAILDAAAEDILERREDLRFVIVAGPSSSGKTTTTLKLTERLTRAGQRVVPLSLDNYFFDLELHPRDLHGDYDFETPEAMDLPLVNEHLAELDAGRGIDMPRYDFRRGLRTTETTRFEPPPDSLILLDTLHGLYDGLTASVAEEHKYRVYIETICQLKDGAGQYVRWSDIRLLRRMLRDSLFRAYSPERTILHWHYVRRSELKHIIPHQGAADFIVNSALAYELLFLKKHLVHHFPEYLERWADDPTRLDAFLRAERIHALLSSLADVEDETMIPAGSLLREFIGGSSYDVH